MLVKKHMIALFVDNGKTGEDKDWVRIRKGTTFDMALNPTVNSRDYIADAHPTNEVDDYSPSINQAITMYTGEKDYELLFPLARSLPTGDSAKRDVLVVFSMEPVTEEQSGSTAIIGYRAWKTNATLSFTNINGNEGTLTMDINFGGTIENGYATPDTTTHKVTFTNTDGSDGEWVDPFAQS